MTTKPKAAKTAKKKSTDIPLENIPERTTRKAYTSEFKKQAADRVIAGEVADQVAKELGIPSSSVIHGWVQKVKSGQPLNSAGGSRTQHPKSDEQSVATVLRRSLEHATRARDERLEAAACIVEADGSGAEAASIAKKIRAYKRS